MLDDAPLRLFNIYDPQRAGLVAGLNALGPSSTSGGIFVRNDGEEILLGLVRPSDSLTRQFDYIDPTGATIELALGALDRAPTAGTFAGSYNGSSTGLTGLAYNISAATLQTALNSNSGVTTGGQTVAVTKTGDNTWTITWSGTGSKYLLVWDTAGLTPDCTATCSRVVTGDSTHREVQILRINQRPYGYCSTWQGAIVSSSVANPTVITCSAPHGLATGDKVNIRRHIGASATVDGTYTATVTGTKTFTVPVNVGTAGAGGWFSAARISQIQTGSSTLPSVQRVTFFNEPYEGAATLGFSRQQVVRVVAKANTGGVAEVSSVQALSDGGVKNISTIATTANTSNNLNGLYFDIYDKAGPVRVWFDSANTGTAPAVPSGGRLLEVDLANNDTATQVATKLAAAIEADSEFTSSSSSNLCTITDVVIGTRTAISAGTTGATVATRTAGAASSRHDTVACVLQDDAGVVQVHLSHERNGTGQATGDTITCANHGFSAAQAVTFPTLTGGAGLSTSTTYYVKTSSLATGTFQVVTSSDGTGTAVDITSDYTALTCVPYDAGTVSVTTGVPSNGRRISVPINPSSTSSAIAAQIKAVLDADAEFAATVSGSVVTITNSDGGARTAIATGSAAFTVARVTAGAYGVLHDTHFTLYDDRNEAVAVYFTQSGSAPATGHDALDASRYLSVTVAAGDSAGTVATAIASAIDADADFTASASSTVVTVTNAGYGARTAAQDETSGCAVAVTTEGLAFSINLPYDASEELAESLLGNDFTVAKTGRFAWDITFPENGAQNAFTVDPAGLAVPFTVRGTRNLATAQLFKAFADVTTSSISAIEEGQVTFADRLPWTFYRREVTIYRDLIDFTTLYPTPLQAFALPRIFNVEDYGALHDGSTDDTAAINAALAACYNAGGGRVYFPSGHYVVEGSFGTANSMLLIPGTVAAEYPFNPVVVELVGEACASLDVATNGTYRGGVLIDATGAGTGSGTAPSILACTPYVATTFNSSGCNFCDVEVRVNGMMFLAPANPSFGGLNFANCIGANIGDDVIVAAAWTASGVAPFNGWPAYGPVQPTDTDARGIWLPQVLNYRKVTVGAAHIMGWYDGLIAYEHAFLSRPRITYCRSGLVCQSSTHLLQGDVSIENCIYGITGTGTVVMDLVAQFENGNTTASPSAWWSTTNNLYGAGTGTFIGRLAYEIGTAGTGAYVAVNTTHTFSGLQLTNLTTGVTAMPKLNLFALPTSASGLATGDLWNDSGTIKIA